jgi:hypothetical protein
MQLMLQTKSLLSEKYGKLISKCFTQITSAVNAIKIFDIENAKVAPIS